MREVKLPTKKVDAKVGETILVSGTIYTARDLAHRRIIQYIKEGKELPFDLQGYAVFHAGPIARKENDKWKIISIGPTTSARMEMFTEDLLKYCRPSLIIGKGGFNKETTKMLAKHNCTYASFTGGCSALATACIKEVEEVYWLDLGIAEAVWKLNVERLPCLVSIADGENLYVKVKEEAEKICKSMF